MSEPEKYEIPVEVTKDIYDICSRGVLRNPKRGEQFVSAHGDCYVSTADSDYRNTPRLVLTPRVPSYEYPKELMSPEVWGIAADSDWWWWVYSTEPKLEPTQFSSDDDCQMWDDIAWMLPNVVLPTPEQCHNDWRQSCFKNPNYGKGE